MISNDNLNVHFKTINYTLAFVLFLIVISNFPHDAQPIVSWINCSIYFLIFLQSVFLIKQTRQNKSVFFNFALFALFHSLNFVIAYMGERHWFGSPDITWKVYVYYYILLTFLFSFSSLFICVKYFFNRMGNAGVYAISLAIIIPVFLWHFYPIVLNPQSIFSLNNIDLNKLILRIDFLPLFFLILYGVLLYQYDRSLGEHINTIMVCFFIMTIMDITNLVGSIYKIMIFSFTQYVLLTTLTFFVITCFRLINHVYSTFGQFYDAVALSGASIGVPIKRKKSASVSFLTLARAYFHQRRNTIAFLTLVFIFCINYFSLSLFVKLNLAVFSFGALLLFYYLSALYHKRLRTGNILNFRRLS